MAELGRISNQQIPSESKPILSETRIDAVKFLCAQHRDIEILFKQLEGTIDRGSHDLDELLAALAHKIERHAKIEEELFYPKGKKVDDDAIMEATEEHELIRVMIKKIRDISTDDNSFGAKLTVLQELVQHHVEEEEKELFPKMEQNLDSETLGTLGAQLSKRFDELSEFPLTSLPIPRAAASVGK